MALDTDPAWYLLVFGVVPLWLGAGFLDYLCHRAAAIERASGSKESALHWLMLGEVGLPLLAAVFLKIDALLIGFMLVCWVAHEITTHLDLQLAIRTRKVGAFEQQVHAFLEILPLAAIGLIAILHWSQACALFGFGHDTADFSLAIKPLPPFYQLTLLFGALFLFGAVPYTDELIRGLRYDRVVARSKDLPA